MVLASAVAPSRIRGTNRPASVSPVPEAPRGPVPGSTSLMAPDPTAPAANNAATARAAAAGPTWAGPPRTVTQGTAP